MTDYLQHARRHLPTGSDPIPGFTLIPALPSALFTASADIPVTSFGTSSNIINLDTFTGDTNYFSVASSGEAQLAEGLYLAVGFVEFASPQDWSTHTDALTFGFETSFFPDSVFTGFTQQYGKPTDVQVLNSTHIINIPSPQGIWLTVGISVSSINPLPANIVVAKAAFTRLSGSI